MGKINFKEIVVKDIEGKEQKIDMRYELGNLLYIQGKNIIEHELGHKIYHTVGDLEMSEEETAVVKEYAQRYPYLYQKAIADAIKQ